MVARGGKQDRSLECRCAKTDGLSMVGTDLMGKLLIASIDFMSSRVAQKLITDWSVVVNHVGCFQTGKHGRHLNNTCNWKDIATIGNSKTLQCTNAMYHGITEATIPSKSKPSQEFTNAEKTRKIGNSESHWNKESNKPENQRSLLHNVSDQCILYKTRGLHLQKVPLQP